MITKVVILFLSIVGAWYLFRFGARLNEARAERFGAGGAARAEKARTAKASANKREIEDLTKCATCGAYVSAGARACSRGDCHYPK